jgi:quercetin dioxygenase-like cupin family protein
MQKAGVVAASAELALLALVFIAPRIIVVHASDADPQQDFCVTADPGSSGGKCKPAASVTARDFKSGVLAELPVPVGKTGLSGISLALASAANVGGLNAQGLSLVRIDFAPGGLVPPHVHPRASEVLFVLRGSLRVAFIDTSGRLFAESVHAGELFVFPRGLVHYITNDGPSSASSLSALNSQNPGTSLIPNALFASQPSVPDADLQKAFHLSLTQVRHLKRSYASS